MKNLNVEKMVTIKNYEAGKNGNMLVVLVDKLVPITVQGPKGDDRDVEVLLCTATISDQAVIDALETKVDSGTSCNKIIVVSQKFMKLNNKKQLILLEIENQKVQFMSSNEDDNNSAAVIWAEVNAIEKFGKIAERFAVAKARNLLQKHPKDCIPLTRKMLSWKRSLQRLLRNVIKLTKIQNLLQLINVLMYIHKKDITIVMSFFLFIHVLIRIDLLSYLLQFQSIPK